MRPDLPWLGAALLLALIAGGLGFGMLVDEVAAASARAACFANAPSTSYGPRCMDFSDIGRAQMGVAAAIVGTLAIVAFAVAFVNRTGSRSPPR